VGLRGPGPGWLGEDLAAQRDAVDADPHVRSRDQAALIAARVAAEGAAGGDTLGRAAGAGAPSEGGARDTARTEAQAGLDAPHVEQLHDSLSAASRMHQAAFDRWLGR